MKKMLHNCPGFVWMVGWEEIVVLLVVLGLPIALLIILKRAGKGQWTKCRYCARKITTDADYCYNCKREQPPVPPA